jgi:hypothetical protein
MGQEIVPEESPAQLLLVLLERIMGVERYLRTTSDLAPVQLSRVMSGVMGWKVKIERCLRVVK